MNLTETKFTLRKQKNVLIQPIDRKKSSNPFITEYESDYEKKKEAEKKAVHEEILNRYDKV